MSEQTTEQRIPKRPEARWTAADICIPKYVTYPEEAEAYMDYCDAYIDKLVEALEHEHASVQGEWGDYDCIEGQCEACRLIAMRGKP